MARIRVMVVDDAVVIRKILTDVLSADPELEVVGTAPNGRIALQKIPQINPDIITLDMEMPEMGGIETLQAIRKDYPRLPVIMFSTLTEKGALSTLEALASGASDYVTKPANVGSVTNSFETVRNDLIAKIKMLAGSLTLARSVKKPTVHPPARSNEAVLGGNRSTRKPVQIVCIGVSTGGPNALVSVLPKFPRDFAAPIVIVQHMPAMFTKLLAERLDSLCALRVVEASEGMEVLPGTVYLAPGNYHMELRNDSKVTIGLNQEARENSCRPAVDVLFRSVAEIYGGHALSCILTGMGQDGLRGVELLREKGARVIVQDEKSSVVWGMPGIVAESGLADEILPLEQIAPRIIDAVQRDYSSTASSKSVVSEL